LLFGISLKNNYIWFINHCCLAGDNLGKTHLYQTTNDYFDEDILSRNGFPETQIVTKKIKQLNLM